MIEYRPSETFHANQGLPSDTEIEPNDPLPNMQRFISLFVGPSIKNIHVIEEMEVNVKRVVIWNLNVTKEMTA